MSINLSSLLNTQGSATAFVNFNGTTGATRGTPFNVSSVTRNSAGNYTINFSTSFADTNYVVLSTASVVGAGSPNSYLCYAVISSQSTSSVTITFPASGAGSSYADPTIVCVVIFGT